MRLLSRHEEVAMIGIARLDLTAENRPLLKLKRDNQLILNHFFESTELPENISVFDQEDDPITNASFLKIFPNFFIEYDGKKYHVQAVQRGNSNGACNLQIPDGPPVKPKNCVQTYLQSNANGADDLQVPDDSPVKPRNLDQTRRQSNANNAGDLEVLDDPLVKPRNLDQTRRQSNSDCAGSLQVPDDPDDPPVKHRNRDQTREQSNSDCAGSLQVPDDPPVKHRNLDQTREQSNSNGANGNPPVVTHRKQSRNRVPAVQRGNSNGNGKLQAQDGPKEKKACQPNDLWLSPCELSNKDTGWRAPVALDGWLDNLVQTMAKRTDRGRVPFSTYFRSSRVEKMSVLQELARKLRAKNIFPLLVSFGAQTNCHTEKSRGDSDLDMLCRRIAFAARPHIHRSNSESFDFEEYKKQSVAEADVKNWLGKLEQQVVLLIDELDRLELDPGIANFLRRIFCETSGRYFVGVVGAKTLKNAERLLAKTQPTMPNLPGNEMLEWTEDFWRAGRLSSLDWGGGYLIKHKHIHNTICPFEASTEVSFESPFDTPTNEETGAFMKSAGRRSARLASCPNGCNGTEKGDEWAADEMTTLSGVDD